ncbi:MAG: hypothetical protein ACTSYR_02825 [Candidatus Odinarchaeia archaeon]
MVKKIFRFEGKIELNKGDDITIIEWREVREGMPLEALIVKNESIQKEFKSTTEEIEMLKPINKTKIKGVIKDIKEKFNLKTNMPIYLFEIETSD